NFIITIRIEVANGEFITVKSTLLIGGQLSEADVGPVRVRAQLVESEFVKDSLFRVFLRADELKNRSDSLLTVHNGISGLTFRRGRLLDVDFRRSEERRVGK